MPPKIRITQEKIVTATFEVIKREGVSAVTAKSVSEVLGTSVAPIFRVFRTIEELKRATIDNPLKLCIYFKQICHVFINRSCSTLHELCNI